MSLTESLRCTKYKLAKWLSVKSYLAEAKAKYYIVDWTSKIQEKIWKFNKTIKFYFKSFIIKVFRHQI